MSLSGECDFNKEFLLQSTILYIEPDDKIREENADIFTFIFKKIYLAKNAQEALELFEQHHGEIDVILSEVNVPDMDAVDMLSKLRKVDWDTPLLITTDFEESKLFLKLIKFNITNYIVKPIQVRTTFKIIAQLMEEEQLKKSLRQQEFENKQFMSILNSINMVCEIDLDGKITSANDLLLMTAGYDADEILNKQHSQFAKEYEHHDTEESIFAYVKQGKVWSGDCKKVTKDGDTYHTFSIILPIMDDEGNIIKYIECATPTTKYKSEIMNLKKQIVSIKSNSFKAIIENKQSQNMQNEMTQQYQQRVDDSVNKEQQLIMEIHEQNKKVLTLEEKLRKQALRFENFQSFHYEKVQEIVAKYQNKSI